jgi:hypothetical protein
MHKKDKEFIIRKAASLSIYGALQLFNQDVLDIVTWQQICDINKRPARGRTLKWFTSLTGGIAFLNSLEIDGKHLTNIQAFKMSKKPPFTDNRKKEFVYMQQDYMLAFGQVKNKY